MQITTGGEAVLHDQGNENGIAANDAGSIDEQVRFTLDHLLEGAQIIDRDWRYRYLNTAAATHGGSTVGALLGRTMMEAFPGIDQTEMFATLRRVMETRVATEIENEFTTPDGTRKWFQLLIQPVPSGLFILSLDITDRKRAEIEQRKGRARIEAIVENLHEGLVLADLAGNLLHWNRAALAMLGFRSLAEARNAIDNFGKIFRVTGPDGTVVPDHQRPLARVLRGETFQNLELHVARAGEQWQRIFEYSGGIAHYSENEALAFVTIRDVTERKELEQQFVRAQRMDSIGSLASGIAHDLNNVLMPIIMGTSFLRRCVLDERAMRTIDDIERSAKRGADLVRQVLSFARGVTTPWSAIDIRDIVGEVESIAKRTFPKNITLKMPAPGSVHAVIGDATQLLQIVLNLCVNARDAMPNGGRISITVHNATVSEPLARTNRANPGPYVVLEVADQGEGIPADMLAKIFEPFFTTKAVGKGTGLGLYTVQDIVRSHGGFIDVHSEVGRGTRFCVFLPAHVTAAVPAASQPQDELPRGNGELILLVDDEITILRVVKQTLEAYGYEVLIAEDGAQASDLYAQYRDEIRVVVTDMMMPVMDGAALVTTLLQANPDLHIIATSGTSSHDWRTRAENAGATNFLTKPYTATLLLRMLAELLAKPRT